MKNPRYRVVKVEGMNSREQTKALSFSMRVSPVYWACRGKPSNPERRKEDFYRAHLEDPRLQAL